MIRSSRSGNVSRMSLIARAFISSGAALIFPTAIVITFRTTAKGLLMLSLSNFVSRDTADQAKYRLFITADSFRAHERDR